MAALFRFEHFDRRSQAIHQRADAPQSLSWALYICTTYISTPLVLLTAAATHDLVEAQLNRATPVIGRPLLTLFTAVVAFFLLIFTAADAHVVLCSRPLKPTKRRQRTPDITRVSSLPLRRTSVVAQRIATSVLGRPPSSQAGA